MPLKIFEKKLIRKANGKIDVKQTDKEHSYKSVEGCFDIMWYIAESAIPEQILYCPICILDGKRGVIKEGRCMIHKNVKAKQAFKELTEEEKNTNLNFIKNNKWIVEAVCDASPKRFDSNKIVRGIISINENNKKLSFNYILNKHKKQNYEQNKEELSKK